MTADSPLADDTPVWQLTVGQFKALIATAIITHGQPDQSQLLDATQIQERYHVGREALRAAAGRGELQLVRGSRGKILARAADIETWFASRLVQPRKRNDSASTTPEPFDPFSDVAASLQIRKAS